MRKGMEEGGMRRREDVWQRKDTQRIKHLESKREEVLKGFRSKAK